MSNTRTVSCHSFGFFFTGWVGILLSALHMFSYGNKFIYIVEFGYTNIKSKIKINGLLIQPLYHKNVRSSSEVSTLNVVIYQCGYKVLATFIDADTRIKGVQIGDHEVKILNFSDDTTVFFLRDIN